MDDSLRRFCELVGWVFTDRNTNTGDFLAAYDAHLVKMELAQRNYGINTRYWPDEGQWCAFVSSCDGTELWSGFGPNELDALLQAAVQALEAENEQDA